MNDAPDTARQLRARQWGPRLIFAAVALMSACSRPVRPPPPPADIPPVDRPLPPQPRKEPRSRSGNPPFYEVFGKRYFVLPSSAGYAERGVASWYGPGFHGKPTANGEKYDMHGMSAAHKTLPLPSYVQVTHLGNGKTITVRVNDRGPFVGNRMIDLSRAAAEELGIMRAGTALVDVRAVGSPPVAPVAPDSLFVQAGAFTEPANAERLLQRLRAAGLGPAFLRQDSVDGRALYRVRVGPVPTVAEFDRVVEELRGVGVTDARLALD